MNISKVIEIIVESTSCRCCKLEIECSRKREATGEYLCDEAIEFLTKINKQIKR